MRNPRTCRACRCPLTIIGGDPLRLRCVRCIEDGRRPGVEAAHARFMADPIGSLVALHEAISDPDETLDDPPARSAPSPSTVEAR